MKIFYILHQFLPRYFSGTEVYTFSLAKEMQRRGHSVQVFCADNVEEGSNSLIQATEDTYQGVPVHRIYFNRKKTPDVVRYLYANPFVADHLTEVLSICRPDLVHITSLVNVSAAVIDVVKSFSLPALFTATDYWCFCPRGILLDYNLELCDQAEANKCLGCIISRSPLYYNILSRMGLSQETTTNLLLLAARIPGLKNNSFLKARDALEERPLYLRESLEKLDLIIAPSAFMRQLFLKAGLAKEKVIISGYGLGTDGLVQQTREGVGAYVRFAYMGRLGELKGIDLLIRSFSALDGYAQAALAIYGDESHSPRYVDHLKKLAANNGAVSFNGTFPPDRLGNVLAGIDVLVVPSLWYENAPLVIQSAFAAGIPVVGTNVPGITELVSDGVNGFLFPRGDERALTTCLKRFLDEPKLLPQLRANIQPVKTITENGSELEELYGKIRGRRSGVRENCSP